MLRRVTWLIEPIKYYNKNSAQWIAVSFRYEGRCISTSTKLNSVEQAEEQPLAKKNLSKAMKAYLERAKEHDVFMEKRKQEFQIGKRHLANMMGHNPETFTQEDIDEAIEYLFPSGLYEKRARPMMKPPEEIYPERKAAEFDETGRPHHFLFYTAKPNYYQILHETVGNINELNQFEDAMNRKGLKPDLDQAIGTSGYNWLSKEGLEKRTMETLGDRDYEAFVQAMERLISHPYSYRVKEFIATYREPLMSHSETLDAAKPQYDEEGRAFVTTYECLRRRARGDVTIRSPGTGKITINGKGIEYFEDVQPREQVLFPLVFTNMVGKVDIEANVTGGGPSGQAGAIRWGIAWGLRSFVDVDTIEKMRIAGLLTRDYRTRERKKPGQEGARRKFTWKKR